MEYKLSGRLRVQCCRGVNEKAQDIKPKQDVVGRQDGRSRLEQTARNKQSREDEEVEKSEQAGGGKTVSILRQAVSVVVVAAVRTSRQQRTAQPMERDALRRATGTTWRTNPKSAKDGRAPLTPLTSRPFCPACCELPISSARNGLSNFPDGNRQVRVSGGPLATCRATLPAS